MRRALAVLLPLAAVACAPPPPPVEALRTPEPPHLDEPACCDGSPEVCVDLGTVLAERGDREGSRGLFALACRYRVGRGCMHLAEMALADHDDPHATGFYGAACDVGEAAGCGEYARRIDAGLGTWRDLVTAREVAARGCEGGDTSVCALAAGWVGSGIAGPRDDSRAAALLARGCPADARACVGLARAEREGLGTPADPAKAASHDDVACEAKVAEGCHWLANAADVGLGVPKDPARAAALRARACELGNARSCTLLHHEKLCEAGGARECRALGTFFRGASDALPAPARGDALHGRALATFERQCAIGVSSACAAAGAMRERGEGAPADLAAARKLDEKACGGGVLSLPGCVALGSLKARGLGGPREAAGAAALFEKACAAGEGEGCLELAHLAARGEGVAKDPLHGLARLVAGCNAAAPSGPACHEAAGLVESASMGCGMRHDVCKRSRQMLELAGLLGAGELPWLKLEERAAEILSKACDADDGRACARLGAVRLHGFPDMAKVLALFTHACDLGEPDGCAYAGVMLTAYGATELPRDPERAVGFLERACDAGVASACGDLGGQLVSLAPVAVPLPGVAVSGKDRERGRALLAKGCDAGNAEACFKRANLGGDDPKTRAAFEAKGKKALDAACGVDPWTCYLAAQHTSDPASATKKNTAACEWGVTHACAAIGAIHFAPSPPSRR